MNTLQDDIQKDPYRRPPSMYNYKVKKLSGNHVTFVDATKKDYTVELQSDVRHTLEEQYGNDIDNLFIAVSYNNTYFFYRKLSNDKVWRTN